MTIKLARAIIEVIMRGFVENFKNLIERKLSWGKRNILRVLLLRVFHAWERFSLLILVQFVWHRHIMSSCHVLTSKSFCQTVQRTHHEFNWHLKINFLRKFNCEASSNISKQSRSHHRQPCKDIKMEIEILEKSILNIFWESWQRMISWKFSLALHIIILHISFSTFNSVFTWITTEADGGVKFLE